MLERFGVKGETRREGGKKDRNFLESRGRKDLLTFATEFCNGAEGRTRAAASPFERSILHQTFATCQALCLQA